MTATVITIPTPMPVLKIPPIMLHELTIKVRNTKKIAGKDFILFMTRNFSDIINTILINLN
jgi:hypothetical protein